MMQLPRNEQGNSTMNTKAKKVTKAQWYAAGGFKNSQCYRKADYKGVWAHFILNESI